MLKIKQVFFRKDQVRLIWPFFLVVLLVVLGEMLVVDPIGSLIQSFGFKDSPNVVEHEWSLVIHDVLKRSIRSIIILLAIWLPLRFVMGHPFQFSGYRFKQGWTLQLMQGVSLGFLIQLIPLVLMWIFGWYHVEGWLWNYKPFYSLFPALLFSFIFASETAILEESLFRGFMMNTLSDRYNVKVGLAASSILFGLLHFSGTGSEFPWWLSLVSATIAGFVFGQAYLLYGNIWVPLGIHFGVHFAARTLGTVGLTPDEATMLVTNVEGPVSFIVTKAGGASIFELIGYCVASISMLMISRIGKIPRANGSKSEDDSNILPN